MCFRVNSCCCCSLRQGTIIIAVYSTLLTLAVICLGGYFLFEWLTYPGRGEYEHVNNDANFGVFGGVYLSLGTIWCLVLLLMYYGIYIENAGLILPWLVLQLVSLGLGIAQMLTQAIIMDFMSLIALPFLVIGLFQIPIVFSYFMELHEAMEGKTVGTI